MDLSKYKSLFLNESREYLQGMTERILSLEDATSKDGLDWLFRAAHSIKGMSASMGYEPVANLSHKIENVLDLLKKGQLAFDDNARAALFEGIDLIQSMLNDIDSGTEARTLTNTFEGSLQKLRIVSSPRATEEKFLYKIELKFAKERAGDGSPALPILKRIESAGRISKVIPAVRELSESAVPPETVVCYLVTSRPAASLEELLQPLAELERFSVSPVDPHTRFSPEAEASALIDLMDEPLRLNSVRVETERIDHVIDNLGELLIQHAQLQEVFPDNPDIARIEKLGRSIYEAARDLRMLPFDTLAGRIPRMIYELSKKLDKNIRVKIEGADIQMDKSVLTELADPLIHLVRNAADHGIEPPAVRAATRKGETGTIKVTAAKKGDRLYLSVEDDGRGIDPQIVKKIAVEKRLIDEQAVARLNTQELLNLITRPGFSTSEIVSELSGRGVGLDAVRAKVDSLAGELRIHSMPGRYTRFEMILPFTIALVPALLIRLGNLLCAVPLSRVDRVILIRSEQLQYTNGRPVLYSENEAIQIQNLWQCLYRQDRAFEKVFPAFVTEHQNRKIAWAVDELLTERRVLLRLLGEPLKGLNYYAGGTILSKGEVIPVLDIEQIYRDR
jgi:two-component system chemotaxis sensor kinase CheA